MRRSPSNDDCMKKPAGGRRRASSCSDAAGQKRWNRPDRSMDQAQHG
ncbi:hypothetical protein HMPREF1155_1105 [Slackia sp. CM382]|nr:hypothetical protein HMPREF1155_1105 [Slackia sp. CM382]